MPIRQCGSNIEGAIQSVKNCLRPDVSLDFVEFCLIRIFPLFCHGIDERQKACQLVFGKGSICGSMVGFLAAVSITRFWPISTNVKRNMYEPALRRAPWNSMLPIVYLAGEPPYRAYLHPDGGQALLNRKTVGRLLCFHRCSTVGLSPAWQIKMNRLLRTTGV